MIEVVLYTRPGCGLCDEAKALLADLAVRYPHRLTEVNIAADEALYRRYRHIIPVVRIANRVTLQAPLDAGQLEAALRQANLSPQPLP